HCRISSQWSIEQIVFPYFRSCLGGCDDKYLSCQFLSKSDFASPSSSFDYTALSISLFKYCKCSIRRIMNKLKIASYLVCFLFTQTLFGDLNVSTSQNTSNGDTVSAWEDFTSLGSDIIVSIQTAG